jgi:probable DNA metabolism protein
VICPAIIKEAFMLTYVYDGSFEGLLTSVFEAFYRKQDPGLVKSRENLQYSLVDEYVQIDTDPGKSDRVYRSILEKISYDALQHVYHVFLSDDEAAGTLIYNYLKLGWKLGSKVDFYLTDGRVLKVHEISQRLEFELHRMLGFIRFRQVEGGIYYAPCKPDNNLVELLAPHFAERLQDQSWIIHDVGRNIAALYNKKTFMISEFSVDDIPGATNEENEYQKLWKEFFNTLAIPSRSNPKLR